MSWGPFWMFYICPACGKKFRYMFDYASDPEFGTCPACGAEGVLSGESSNLPPDENEYEYV